jgi:circadian clock protein KaiC
MLNGGFPRRRIILIRGSPGAGKTILCSQFLYNGFIKYGQPGLYVSMEETKEELIREMFLVGMDFRKLRDDEIEFMDASPIRHTPAQTEIGKTKVGKREFSLVALGEMIKNVVQERKATRIVIDPLTALSIQYPNDEERWPMILDLIEALKRTGATCLITEDLRATRSAGTIPIEDYGVHGTIIMEASEMAKGMVKTIRIAKMRETNHDDQTRIYEITNKGIDVYPTSSWTP